MRKNPSIKEIERMRADLAHDLRLIAVKSMYYGHLEKMSNVLEENLRLVLANLQQGIRTLRTAVGCQQGDAAGCDGEVRTAF